MDKTKVLKRLYFVRHGQTEDNIRNVYQSAEDVLTEKGREQAVLVAERLACVPADILITSDFSRAKETAEIIAKRKSIPLIVSELFHEIRRPSDIVGKEKNAFGPKRIMDEMIENELTPNWHHLDEENLFESLTRVRSALDYIIGLPEENIMIVTHEMLTKMLLSAMAINDDAKTVEFYRQMRYFMIGDNTGVTVAEYGNFVNGNRFRLRLWNDHSHLE